MYQIVPVQDVFKILFSKVYPTQFFVPPMTYLRHRSACSCLYFLSNAFSFVPHLEQKSRPSPNWNRLIVQSLRLNILHTVNWFCLKFQTNSICPQTFCTNLLSKNRCDFAIGTIVVACRNPTELRQMQQLVCCFYTRQIRLEPERNRTLDTVQSWFTPCFALPEKNTASCCVCKLTDILRWVVRSLPIEFAMLLCMMILWL